MIQRKSPTRPQPRPAGPSLLTALAAAAALLAWAASPAHAGAVATDSRHADAEPRKTVQPVDPDAQLIQLAARFIEPHEGRRLEAYSDSLGYRTVGVGFNLDRAGARADLARLLPEVNYDRLRQGRVRLTDAQVDRLLQHDVARALRTARREVEDFEALPLRARLIVIDMTYNMGSLRDWKHFRAALAQHAFARAADEMYDSRWRRQTGHRAASLIGLMREIARSGS